jgi:Cft2 family RNA processing exonuclease
MSDQAADSDSTWRIVQQAWATGNLQTARDALSGLLKSSVIEDAATWRLWGDRAAAMGDLGLAVKAYERAQCALGPGESGHRWLHRRLYSQVQSGIDPATIESDLRTELDLQADSLFPTSLEERLISLALETELYYRMGQIPQACVAGKEFLEAWSDSSDAAFEFLGHVQDRIWTTLARLAEESGNVSAARHFLVQLDGLRSLAPELQGVVSVLRVLLNMQPMAAAFGQSESELAARQLESVLALTPDVYQPPVPPALLASLQKTHNALLTETEKLSLLEEAVGFRPTNMLARYWYIQELECLENGLKQLTAEASIWLSAAPEQSKELIRRSLTRPEARKRAQFAFMALGGGSVIGGSAYLVDLNSTKVLLDVGMDVAASPRQSYRRLKRDLAQSGVVSNLAELDAVIVSHAHLDHIGLLPALHSDRDLPRIRLSSGYRPRTPFYASKATREIARIMLEDTAAQMSQDSQPLYTSDDVVKTIDDLRTPKDGRLHLFQDLGQIEMLDGNHILGASMVLLENDGFRVLYTGDFNTRSQLTLPELTYPKGLRPDVLIVESTYGYQTGDWLLPRQWRESAFISHMDRVLRRGGVLLLPAFAVGRSQEVLGLVADHARLNPDLSYNVYLDGLSRTITRCYDKFDQHLTDRYRELRARIEPRLTMVSDDTDRRTLICERILGRPSVIIASSGMLKQGSMAYQYAEHIVGDRRNAIFYTGYLAEDSEASAFLERKTGNAVDTGLEIRCEQRRFHFSAHAPKEDLLQFVIDVQPRAVILVHGETRRGVDNPDNLYVQLQQLECSSLQVFQGQERHRIMYKDGRFFQQ